MIGRFFSATCSLGQDAPPPAAAPGDESVKTGEVEGLHQTQHMARAEA